MQVIVRDTQMSIWNQILSNNMVIATLCGWFTAQVLKTLINWAINKKFNPDRIFGCGGMPSSHSATVCALATSVGLNCGFDGFEFAMSLTFAIVVMYDALNVRLETGKQAVIINHLLPREQIREILSGTPKDKRTKKPDLKEYVGHTPFQVLAGMLVGIVVALFVC